MLNRQVFKLAIIVPTLILGLLSPPIVVAKTPLPSACQTACVTDYGKPLGSDAKGVTAFSNCNSSCVVFDPNKVKGVYTGIKWQCVEYARRWLLENKKVVYGDVDVAADIWKLDNVSRPADNKHFSFESFLNGSTSAAQAGDLLIYGKEFLDTGHVAVITEVDIQNNSIKVAEQNFNNDQWHGDFARTITFHVENNRFWILDPYLIGWKRIGDQVIDK